VPPHLTRASAGVRGVVVAVSLVLLHLPWHEARGQAICTGSIHYGSSLAVLLGVGLVAVLFARTHFGEGMPWSLAPIGLASGIVTALAAGAALSITAVVSHTSEVVPVGKAAEMFRAFQWVLVALGMWQVYLHGAVLMRTRPKE
jgi:hypothetical protein